MVQGLGQCFGQQMKSSTIVYKAQTLQTIEGNKLPIEPGKGNKALVILFVSPECPLCQSYSLTIRNLYETYHSKGINFIAVVPGTDFTKEEIIKYRNSYGLKKIPFCLDPNNSLSKQLKASITPEVFVITKSNEQVYSGRIDNWAYELGKKRAVITEHDLRDVLAKISQDIPVKPYQTKAVGCFIN